MTRRATFTQAELTRAIIAAAFLAMPANAAVVQYAHDPEPMVMTGAPGPYTAVIMYDPPAIEFVRRPVMVSFARLGDDQCLDKFAGPVPCDAPPAVAPLVDWWPQVSGKPSTLSPRAPYEPHRPLPPIGPPVIVYCCDPKEPPPAPVPIPATGWLLALGFLALRFTKSRRAART